MRRIVFYIEVDTEVDDEELNYTLGDLVRRVPYEEQYDAQWYPITPIDPTT